MFPIPFRYVAALCLALLAWTALGAETPPRLTFESLPSARFSFSGPVGERIQANLEHWLLRAPQANPGLLEMFRLRDRKPTPDLVPWAGEFVGKYLISAIQALRLTGDPRLRGQIVDVVGQFIASQADDGYLGPFPKPVRLLKHWDLWGHYHAIQALVMWHEDAGDAAALAAARKAADLVCNTYLDTGRRVLEAGDPEMNMSILTALAMLHRVTGEPRYLKMAREVEKDWERAGDYLRAGLDGREFHRSPRPRWESLHDLQGLLELWRITGDPRYRQSFEHHWRSIRRWDRRNTGGFSSGEQATGNPFAPTPIETCCTVAWMALTTDYLRLTGDPRAADDLELATLNGGLGAQHPSGRWWTYNTPMDGTREASAHTIVFQSRAGTPELNCCSVNAPRISGMLSEWALMSLPQGLVVNSYLPGKFTVPRPEGEVILTLDRDYPVGDSQRIFVMNGGGSEWTLRLRIPTWSHQTRVAKNFEGPPLTARPGSYLEIRRRWVACDEITLHFDMALRAVPGANEATGNVSLYRGPLLLAYDQAHNAFDEDALPVVNRLQLGAAQASDPRKGTAPADPLRSPWITVEVPTVDGRPLRLVDFASAGATGTRYRSWLAAHPVLPPPAFTQLPPDAARVPVGPVHFQWRGARSRDIRYRVEFSTDPDFAQMAWSTNTNVTRMVVNAEHMQAIAGATPHPIYWRVVILAEGAESLPDVPPAWFQIDPTAAPQSLPPEPKLGPHGEIAMHTLRGDAKPAFGELHPGNSASRNPDGTEVNGRDQMLVYRVPVWPEEDYSVALRVRLAELPSKRIGQVFSAWAGAMDDPLRLVVDGGRLFARIEAGAGFSTPGVPLEPGHWYHLAAVKRGTTLKLYLDAREAGSCAAPEFVITLARDAALGGNPHFSGNEFLAARFADFGFYGRALSPEEIAAMARTNR